MCHHQIHLKVILLIIPYLSYKFEIVFEFRFLSFKPKKVKLFLLSKKKTYIIFLLLILKALKRLGILKNLSAQRSLCHLIAFAKPESKQAFKFSKKPIQKLLIIHISTEWDFFLNKDQKRLQDSYMIKDFSVLDSFWNII